MTNNQEPLVSIIIPAFNIRDFIGDAISSAQAQEYSAKEIIVVDDGSKDGTAEYVEQSYPQVRLFRKTNGGAASARNVGLREAKGDLIAFLDGDDVWLSGKLSAQVEYMNANPDVDMLGTNFTFWSPDANGEFANLDTIDSGSGLLPCATIDKELSGWGYHKLLLDNFVWTTTVVMSRSLVESIGFFDETLRLGQDYDYFLRASRKTEIHVLKRAYAAYRQHPGSAIARGADFNYAAHVIETAVSQWGLSSPNGDHITQSQLNSRLQHIHFSSGYRHYQRGNMPNAFDEFLLSIKKNPFHFKSWLFIMLSALGKHGRPQ